MCTCPSQLLVTGRTGPVDWNNRVSLQLHSYFHSSSSSSSKTPGDGQWPARARESAPHASAAGQSGAPLDGATVPATVNAINENR